VLLIWFNRPDHAVRVLEALRPAKPGRIYVAIDGPRPFETHPEDATRIAACRALVDRIDWECEVSLRFSEENQGCGRGPANAITWFFSREKAGIILEDDCVPTPGFLRFAAELLERYQAEPRVMHINGNNFAAKEDGVDFGGFSYGFGRYAQAWGWASWARAWAHFRYEVPEVPDEPLSTFQAKGVDRLLQEAHRERVASTRDRHRHDVWDYQWQYIVMKQGGLCIAPGANQITNIGFGDDATHTLAAVDGVAYIPATDLEFPLKHPTEIAESAAINRWYASKMLGEVSRYRKKALRRWVRGLFRRRSPTA
jgi:hypothetical protein